MPFEGGSMQRNISQAPDGKFKFIETIFDKATSIKRPIQLFSFILAIAFGAIIFQVSPGANLVAFVILLLPFVLMFVVVDKKILETVSNGRNAVLLIVALVIVGSFLTSILVGVMLIKSSREGLIQTPNNALLESAKKAKVQNVKDATFRLTSYLDSYRLISGYYHQALMDCFDPKNTKDPFSTVILLRKELDTLVLKILGLRNSELKEVYGEDQINERVLKLQKSILALDSTRYFWDVVVRIYGEKGKSYKIDDIVDTHGWSDAQLAEVKRVEFSEIEADLIKALGKDIVLKPVNGFTTQDVPAIRNAIRSLGYLSDSADKLNDSEVLSRYNNSIAAYLSTEAQRRPFYNLGDLDNQMPVYLALYDTGLLDFKKFLLKYSPQKSHPILLDLMSRQISLFDLNDLNYLTQDILHERAGVRSAREESNAVLFKIRDEMQSRLGRSSDAEAVLSSPTVEQYFINSLRVFLRKSDDINEDHDLFVGVRTFVFLGQTEVTSAYGQMLQEMLSYYNVFETDLMISALDG